jgi:RNA polymerase sigma-70 factor, ECF subfamily
VAVNAPPAFRSRLLDTLPRLRRYARTLVFDAAAADDLAQNALERALATGTSSTSARHAGVAAVHRAQRLSRRPPARRPADHRRPRPSCSAPGPRRRRDPGPDVGLRLDLLAALRRLNPDQREALLLVCVEQLSYAEVAEVMHVPIGTVMSRVCRARAAMRQFLDGSAAPAAPALRRVV